MAEPTIKGIERFQICRMDDGIRDDQLYFRYGAEFPWQPMGYYMTGFSLLFLAYQALSYSFTPGVTSSWSFEFFPPGFSLGPFDFRDGGGYIRVVWGASSRNENSSRFSMILPENTYVDLFTKDNVRLARVPSELGLLSQEQMLEIASPVLVPGTWDEWIPVDGTNRAISQSVDYGTAL